MLRGGWLNRCAGITLAPARMAIGLGRYSRHVLQTPADFQLDFICFAISRNASSTVVPVPSNDLYSPVQLD
jgi:hypothetical protein